jgi:NAD(P)-dependent dehydrogenase (short-subunit alcohol dehydrogenase family)
MFGRPGAIIFEITDGDGFYYRGSIFYDLVKTSVIRLAFAMSKELRKKKVTALALTPGFLRSEAMLDHFKTTEANWQEVGKRKNPQANSPDQNDAPEDFMISESPRYVGRAVVALASDPEVKRKSGRVFSTWGLSREYGFTDLDGSQPHWGDHAAKKYGEHKVCDDTFYSYWEFGLVDKMFPEWF